MENAGIRPERVGYKGTGEDRRDEGGERSLTKLEGIERIIHHKQRERSVLNKGLDVCVCPKLFALDLPKVPNLREVTHARGENVEHQASRTIER